ncbi:hypothetical protein GTN66_02135 [bacterium]|nr:hypothetical protein [bacterium]NIN92014.1 hypothetical protein [bacterium]NIO18230.1 hypothetical protein [bacterium]NIO73204.1 hypothetical protein [bacterium]
MNIHSFPPLFGGIANPTLGVLVFLRRKSEVNRIFMLLCLTIGVWNIHEFGLYIAPDALFAVYWARIFGLGLMLIPPVFLHFVMTFVGDNTRRAKLIVSGSYLIGLTFVILFWTGLLVNDYFYVISQYFPRPTKIYNIYIMFFMLATGYGILKIFVKYQKTVQNLQRIQYRFFLIAILLAVGIGMTNFLLSWGVRMYPIGHLGGITFTSIMAWILVKYYQDLSFRRKK